MSLRFSPHVSREWSRYLRTHLPFDASYKPSASIDHLLFATHRPSPSLRARRIAAAPTPTLALVEARRKPPKTVPEWQRWLTSNLPLPSLSGAAILMADFVTGLDFAYTLQADVLSGVIPYPRLAFVPSLRTSDTFFTTSTELGAALVSISALRCAAKKDLDALTPFALGDGSFTMRYTLRGLFATAGVEEGYHPLWWPAHHTALLPPHQPLSSAAYASYDVEYYALVAKLQFAQSHALPTPTVQGLQRLHRAADFMRAKRALTVL